MKWIKKLADNFEGYCCAVMLAVMSVVVFMQVVFRFLIKSSLPWSEELSRYLLVYITYFGRISTKASTPRCAPVLMP